MGINNLSILEDRAVIKLFGPDAASFLQGLTTKNILKLEADQASYCLMLTPQGKYFFDFFIINKNDAFYIDIIKDRLEEFIAKLTLYKLRANIHIESCPTINVYVDSKLNLNKDFNPLFEFFDPRSNKMGVRIYSNQEQEYKAFETFNYHDKRILNLVPEGHYDLTVGKSFPQEYGFTKINAIDFDKGCYVGQELVARTHYRGTVRKSLYLISGTNLPILGSELTINSKKIGTMCSSNKEYGLACLRDDDIETLKLNATSANNSLILDTGEYKIINKL
jgi:folate-binding protein YgfZ